MSDIYNGIAEAEKINKRKSPLIGKNQPVLILVGGIVIYVLLGFFQMFVFSTTQWQGVVAQFQVMISVYLTVRVIPRGYYASVILNMVVALMIFMQMLRYGQYIILPGVVIPIITIGIITIIAYFQRQSRLKTDQVVRERISHSKEVMELQEVSIMAMAALAETRDNETGRHIQRTKLYVKVLGEALLKHKSYLGRLNQQQVKLMVASAPLHDIGKVGIQDSILQKTGRLTPEEFEIIKRHTIIGYEAIQKAEDLIGREETFLKNAGEIILYHHERWDGQGYLYQLEGEEIPLAARIMSVADVYDALTSKRCYKEIHSHEEAYQILTAGAGTQFDPTIIEAFVANSEKFRKIADRYKEDEAE